MKSFKIRYDEKKAKKKLKAKLEKVIASDDWKKIGAEYAINQIQGKTRTQKYAKDNSKLKEISEAHKKNKKKLAKYNQKGKSFSPGKSNLTITGQLIESMKRKNDKRSIIIKPEGDRKPYKYKNGYAKKTPSNEELAKYLKEKGFKFIALSDKMKKNLKKLIKEEFYRRLKKL